MVTLRVVAGMYPVQEEAAVEALSIYVHNLYMSVRTSHY